MEPPDSISFVALGVASPAGSKSAFRHRHTGRIVVVDAGGKKTKVWRKVVAEAAKRAMDGRPFLLPPLILVIEFRMQRPQSHYRANGEIKPDAPWVPIVRPDVTKLLRSTEDAMTGIVYEDDAQICEQNISRTYALDDSIGARVTVYTAQWRGVIGTSQVDPEEEQPPSLTKIAAMDEQRRKHRHG